MPILPIVDPEDQHLLETYKWSKLTNRLCDTVYFTTTISGKTYYLHRIILGNPKGLQVDHIDRDYYNCTKRNLRVATSSQNQANRGVQKNSTTGVKGVFPHGKRYRSYITVNRKQIWLGSFDTVAQAKEVYDAAAKQYFGEFSCQ